MNAKKGQREPVAPKVTEELVELFLKAIPRAGPAAANLSRAKHIIEQHYARLGITLVEVTRQARAAAGGDLDLAERIIDRQLPPLGIDRSRYFWDAMDAAVGALLDVPGIRDTFGESTTRLILLRLATGIWFADEVRIKEIPGVDGRPLWTVKTDADVEALRASIATGQVWVRADLVGSADWPKVRAMAADQVRQVTGAKPAGRPAGPTRSRRALIDDIARRPWLTTVQIEALARSSGEWPDDAADDATARSKRVGRLRKAAKKLEGDEPPTPNNT